MFLRFEENPNCGFIDDRVWKHMGEPRPVSAVLRTREGQDVWCPITGLNEKGQPISAQALKVEDSGEGTCWLIYGGLWGLRLQNPPTLPHSSRPSPWSLDDPTQWGEGFLLLPPDGQDIRFIPG